MKLLIFIRFCFIKSKNVNLNLNVIKVNKDNIVDSLVSQTMKNVMNCDNYFEIYNLKSKFLNAWKYLIHLELNIKISTSIKNKKIIFNKLIITINC